MEGGGASQPSKSAKKTVKTCATIIAGLSLAANLWAAGPADSPSPPESAAPLTTNANLFASMESLDSTYKLGRGDRLSFRVLEDKDDARPIIVSDSGEVEIPYYGRVKAEGRTCKQLAQEVREVLLKELYHRATVIVAVDQLNRKRGTVYVWGQVRRSAPIEIPSDEEFTLSKAILMAGGLADFANKKKVQLTRKTGPEEKDVKVFVVDVEEIFDKGRIDKDIRLENGDIINVPQRGINF